MALISRCSEFGDQLKIMARGDNSNVTVYTGDGNSRMYMLEEAGDFVLVDTPPNQLSTVIADSPIQIVQFMTGLTGGTSAGAQAFVTSCLSQKNVCRLAHLDVTCSCILYLECV